MININIVLPNQQIFTIKIDVNSTILDLKYQIMDIQGIHSDEQNLYYNEIKLDDEKKIIDYGIKEDSKICFKRDTKYNLDGVLPINFSSDTIINF